MRGVHGRERREDQKRWECITSIACSSATIYTKLLCESLYRVYRKGGGGNSAVVDVCLMRRGVQVA